MTGHILLLLSLVVYTSGLSIQVEPKTEECFQEDIKKGVQATLQFQVTAGGLLDLDVNLYSPDDTLLKSWSVATEGRETFQASQDGKYKFCFSNLMARWTGKWVSFYFTQGPNPNFARVEHIDPIQWTLEELSEGLSELEEEHKYLRSVERVHRETIDSTNVRMLYWSVFEVVVLVAMGLFQIYYLKRFLEVKSSV